MPASLNASTRSWASKLLAALDFTYYMQYTGAGKWIPAKHLVMLCHMLEAVERGEILRLIITMPPRYGKSETTSKHFPSWYLGKHPDRDVILTSYGANLAEDFSRINRSVVREFGKDLFGIELSGESAAVNRWGIEGQRGGLTAVGAGGPITGRGAHLAIVDDPFKGAEDASSATQRKKVIEWFKTVLYTRLAPGGAIIVIETRWHKEDLAGYLIEEMKAGGETWTVLNLPAIAGENDPLDRAPGEPLWPDRFSLESLQATKRTLGSYWWNCLYQQTPGDPEGHLFKRQHFRYYEVKDDFYILHHPDGPQHDRKVHKSNCIVFQTCDPAGSTKASADYFVLATWALTPDKDLLLLDVIRDRLEGPDQPALFMTGFQRWNPVAQGVEVAGLGKMLYQVLIRMGLPIMEQTPDRDKVTRAIPMAARYASGNVYHPMHAPWLGDYEEEIIAFPNGANDDQVDNASQAFDMMQSIEKYIPAGEYAEGDCIG